MAEHICRACRGYDGKETQLQFHNPVIKGTRRNCWYCPVCGWHYTQQWKAAGLLICPKAGAASLAAG